MTDRLDEKIRASLVALMDQRPEPHRFEDLANVAIQSPPARNMRMLVATGTGLVIVLAVAATVLPLTRHADLDRRFGTATTRSTLSPSSTTPPTTGEPPATSVIARGLQVSGLAVRADGAVIYASDALGHVVKRIASDGTISVAVGNGTDEYSGDGMAATAAGLQDPGALALDNAGNLFVAEPLHSRIRKIDLGGVITTVASAADGLINPVSLAVDAEGILYVADATADRIYRLGADGKLGTLEVVPVDQLAGPDQPLNRPSHVAVATNGDLYATTSGVVYRRSAAGTRTVATPTKFPPPYGSLAVDQEERLYVTHFDRGQLSTEVTRVSPTGTPEVVAKAPNGGGAPDPVMALGLDRGQGLYVARASGSLERVILRG